MGCDSDGGVLANDLGNSLPSAKLRCVLCLIDAGRSKMGERLQKIYMRDGWVREDRKELKQHY